MRIFIAGATGTLGRPVVRSLLARGHHVVGLTRSERGRTSLEAAGAGGVVGNALNAVALRSIVAAARPDVVVHLLTALPAFGAAREKDLRATNDLRISGTANLLDAAIHARAERLVAESFVGVYGPAVFKQLVDEMIALPSADRGAMSSAVHALRSLEDQLRSAHAAQKIETVSLRIGFLYGPDVPSTQVLLTQARRGRLMAPAGPEGMAPFVHIDDAAAAIVAAIEGPVPSRAYNIVDDRPMPLITFLRELADMLGVRPPRRIPLWFVRLAAPVIAILGSVELRLSNARAKKELGWVLRYPSVHDGLPTIDHPQAEAA